MGHIAVPSLECLYQRKMEDFTLPHRFQVIPHGIHMETWIPGGISLQAAHPNYCPIPHGIQVESRGLYTPPLTSYSYP
jgi:hypothetical protein